MSNKVAQKENNYNGINHHCFRTGLNHCLVATPNLTSSIRALILTKDKVLTEILHYHFDNRDLSRLIAICDDFQSPCSPTFSQFAFPKGRFAYANNN